MAGEDSTPIARTRVANCAKLLGGAPAQASVRFKQTSSLDDSLTGHSPFADSDAA